MRKGTNNEFNKYYEIYMRSDEYKRAARMCLSMVDPIEGGLSNRHTWVASSRDSFYMQPSC